ncbi:MULTISPECIES: bifunctional protein-serine/threonine kinase/phosphatase [unclassified Novosphingobium]|uniref:bifunctional protein-serine/threonine kinase/phosphatase n=1 Tax=unclassified Novosphingobium TaxID=2644732 RepID=UPI00146DDE1E|nr:MULTISPECIES: bifunctional protein-serine/threonine kinase/phosphatase [unclassified Novosphingobium]NMN05327.1 serine/threonine protein phosphatase PrpC [Novosphingobium sp. SG919]NMN87622.1 serine/threonine protein phosphatase PrpC [Novosphingobium sp. SG916]
MHEEGRLWAAVGIASAPGPRPENQDFAAAWLGSESERRRHGLAAALADGVSGGKAGRVAAELAVASFFDGFYAQPATIGVAVAAERVLRPYNRWLAAMGRGEAMAHCATTFTALVLRGRRAHVLHVGDSRAWLLRDGRLQQLTVDHCHAHPDMRHVLLRALGLEDTLRLDHQQVALAPHDRLVLTSDGVHGVLSARRIERLLAARRSAEADAQGLVDAALAAGGRDNASAVVLDVVSLPLPGHDGVAGDLARLPILPAPQVGESVDGFALGTLLSEGRLARVFRATDTLGGGAGVVIKFPQQALLSDAAARAAFARELVVGARVNSPFVGSAIAVDESRQTRLYGVQPFYPGMTLEARLAQGAVPFAEALALAIGMARGLAALHRLGIVHRDVKPENVIVGEDTAPRLIDLGVARLPQVEETGVDEIPGTPGYLAPEMFAGEAGSPATDQFALGVVLWRLFARSWPHGQAEAFSRPRFRQPDPPSQGNAALPGWLDAVLLRMVAIDPASRFADMVDVVRALEGGAAVARRPLRPLPLLQRDPLLFWKGLCALLAAALIVAVLWR